MKREHREYAIVLGAIAMSVVVYVVGPIGRSQSSPNPTRPAEVASTRTAEPAPPDDSSEPAQAEEPLPDSDAAAGLAPPSDQAIVTESPRKGPANPKVTIIEAVDFQCPSCAQVPPLLRKIRETWPDDVAVVFKHNPRPADDRAVPSAMAAAAADRQGKFWEYHDKLLSEQKLEDADLARYAKELELDPLRFDTDRRDPRLRERIAVDQTALLALGHDGALLFLVDGRSIQGALTFDAVEDAVSEELKAGRALLADGGRVEQLHALLARNNTGPEFPVYWNGLILGRTAREEPAPANTTTLADVLTGRDARSRPVDPTVWKAEVLGHEPVKGKPDALVTIVEFSDFQCEYCAQVLPTLKRITDKYPNLVRFVWKNNPISSHNRALPAAFVAMAAQDQGKFWDLHDKLFASQSALSDADLSRYATAVGLGPRQIDLALKQGKYKDIVQKDMDLAEKVNARGAPAFFVNGRVLRGARPFEEFDALIDEELTKARAVVAKSGAPKDLYATLMASARIFEPVDPKVTTFALEGRPTRGAVAGDLTFVLYLDFESLNCADTVAAVNELLSDEALKSRLKVVVKQFPHPVRPMARDAAVAALAANDQGKFWEMLAKLFANQRYLMPFQLAKYAQEIGLDQAKYKAYVESDKGRRMIEADATEGRAGGLEGTPTVFINGHLLRPAVGYSAKTFKAIITKYFPKK